MDRVATAGRHYKNAPEAPRAKTALIFFIALACSYALLCGFPKAFADKFNTETSASAHALGMGNAGVNTSRGSYSVFYNPANLAAKDTGTHLELVNFQLEANDGLLALGGHANSVNFQSLQSLYSGLKNNPNVFASGRYSVYPNFTVRNFALGVLYQVEQGAQLRAHDGRLRVKARDRFAPTAALSFRLAGGILRLGASAQYLTVGESDSLVAPPINEQGLNFKNNIKSGAGLVTTGGITVTLPFRFLPSFSLVARNIGNTNFTSTSLVKFGNAGTPNGQAMTFDAAVGSTVYLARRLEMRLEADYKDVTNKMTGGRFRHVFMGTELILYDIVRFRAGLMHGYPTYGFGINTRRASLDIAAYADELDDRLRGARDQRYVLQYSWEIFK